MRTEMRLHSISSGARAALAVLLLMSLGAVAQDATVSGADSSADAGTTPREAPTPAPTVFTPSETVSADASVSFPVDI